MLYYHVRIRLKSDRLNPIVKLDLSKEDLESRILIPYRKGSPLAIRGQIVSLDDIKLIFINSTEQSAELFRPIVVAELSQKGSSTRSSSVRFVYRRLG